MKETSFKCAQNYDVLNDKEDNGLPSVYAVMTSKEPKPDSHSIILDDFVHKQSKTSYCNKVLSNAGLPMTFD